MNKTVLTTGEIAQLLGAWIYGSANVEISGVNSVASAKSDEITFVSSDQYLNELDKSCAAAVLINKKSDNISLVQIVVANVDEALINVLEKFDNKPLPEPGIHPSAVISPSAKLGLNVYVGPFVEICDNVQIGDNAVIGKGCSIGQDCSIGNSTRLDANVAVSYGCRIGNQCVIQANTVIGSTGFGYRAVNNMPKLIPHLGGVVIEDFVEIGANCCIDRAKFGDTIIRMGTKIDNLVQIAHNCEIGRCCMIAALCGIAGSTIMGDGVIMGGQSGLGDHVKVGAGCLIAGQSGVTASVGPGMKLMGKPARDIKEELRSHAYINKLPKFLDSLKQLEKKVNELETTKNNC